VNAQRGERVDEEQNSKGVQQISREIGCGSGGEIPWGASGPMSVNIGSKKHVRGRS
jgi:hypothetical protein